MGNYQEFLTSKIKLQKDAGFAVEQSAINPLCLPHQKDTIQWAIKKGRAMLALSFGLGKTFCQIEILRLIREKEGGRVLIVCPLGVKHQFVNEDGPKLGIEIEYVRNNEEVLASKSDFLITNYERVRDGNIDPAHFIAVTLDEGSVLRSLGSDTTQQFTKVFKDTKYRFVCTATPSPNRYKEIIHYAEFLGVMDRGQALTRFFKRDSQKAGNLTIHPAHESAFWLWVSSWALFLTFPSDLGYSDDGYILPELKVIWHRLTENYLENIKTDSRGQTEVFTSSARSLSDSARERRRSLDARIEHAIGLIKSDDPEKHWLVWHYLEDERKALEESGIDLTTVYGSQDIDKREASILDFSHGKLRILATKPEIAGSGCNFQRFCYSNIFVGIDYKFQDFIQAIHRTHRFQQPHQVEVHIIHTEAEDAIVKTLQEKWNRHHDLMRTMRGIIQEYGLNQKEAVARITRSFGCERESAHGANWVAVNNDCVEEVECLDDNHIDLIVTSIPFGNHYEYSASYNDFGHNENNEGFFSQFDFLVPELHRILKPGRVAAIHVKDRIQYGNVTGLGMPSISPFSDHTTASFTKHGFVFFGRITVVTDVVRENAQTYRLGWSEQCKDGTKMGVGMPEYILLFRKLPTDLSKAYADEPVVKRKDDYTRAQWQLDAHSLWRSSGNRLIAPEDLANMSHGDVMSWFKDRSLNNVYDYQEHVKLGKAMEAKGTLPASFMQFPPQSYSDMVWTDVNYMRSLNGEQFKNKAKNHICPLPFDIVERVINRWSNEGELVFDPFAGLFTVPYCAVKMGRKGYGVELNKEYWSDGKKYCREAEIKASTPTLFDLIEFEKTA